MSNYAGDVSPQDAYETLRANPEATLVDVRTSAEWTYVGLPDLRAVGSDLVCVEWQSFPDRQTDHDFLKHLRDEGVTEGPVYFLCRSGVRSRAAAEVAQAAGYEAFNVLDGFEGPLDPDGHRSVSGWKNVGLPWCQG